MRAAAWFLGSTRYIRFRVPSGVLMTRPACITPSPGGPPSLRAPGPGAPTRPCHPSPRSRSSGPARRIAAGSHRGLPCSLVAVFSQAAHGRTLGSRSLISQFLKGGVDQGRSAVSGCCGRLPVDAASAEQLPESIQPLIRSPIGAIGARSRRPGPSAARQLLAGAPFDLVVLDENRPGDRPGLPSGPMTLVVHPGATTSPSSMDPHRAVHASRPDRDGRSGHQFVPGCLELKCGPRINAPAAEGIDRTVPGPAWLRSPRSQAAAGRY